MNKKRFTEEQIIGILLEQEAGLKAKDPRVICPTLSRLPFP
jgi:hypothetical protein